MERVILVDERDREVGVAEKMRAHAEGLLHRAFSVFVFDRAGRLLLQRRALSKYHSGGLWSNTCCSHPRPGETVAAAARRRLAEEMSFDCELRPAFEFLYRAELGGGLTEHEYDHVFVGSFDGEPRPDPSEVGDWRWIGWEELREDLAARPQRYSYWLRLALEREEWSRLLAA
jgi:isopentenyl-diphosphate Delta-isomerase